jgi:hypothetical protein
MIQFVLLLDIRRICTIMRTETFTAAKIKRHLKQYKIATIEDLKGVLGTDARMTVFRKLKELSYKTSYSHRGKFYALEKTIQFDEQGLWTCKSVWFSILGTLLETVRAFVNNSESGYSAAELDKTLHVSVKESLIQLIRGGRIYRKKFSGVLVYFSINSGVRAKQLIIRTKQHHKKDYESGMGEELLLHELKAAIVLFSSILTEKQKRIYAGLESLKLGYGGDQKIADLLGVDSQTVAKGRQEIVNNDFELDRIRRKGGGRKSVKKKSRGRKGN